MIIKTTFFTSKTLSQRTMTQFVVICGCSQLKTAHSHLVKYEEVCEDEGPQ